MVNWYSETRCCLRYSFRHADSLSALQQGARSLTSFSLAEQPQVRAAMDWFAKNLKWINDLQSALTEIPAPSFQEEKRAAAVRAAFAAEGLPAQTA